MPGHTVIIRVIHEAPPQAALHGGRSQHAPALQNDRLIADGAASSRVIAGNHFTGFGPGLAHVFRFNDIGTPVRNRIAYFVEQEDASVFRLEQYGIPVRFHGRRHAARFPETLLILFRKPDRNVVIALPAAAEPRGQDMSVFQRKHGGSVMGQCFFHADNQLMCSQLKHSFDPPFFSAAPFFSGHF